MSRSAAYIHCAIASPLSTGFLTAPARSNGTFSSAGSQAGPRSSTLMSPRSSQRSRSESCDRLWASAFAR